ncbi:hypothetical protein CDEF62S_04768 [Castellaniella defragrans]
MLYEVRTYQLRNGGIPEYLKVVGQQGIAIQKRHLGQLIAYFHSEIGPINEIMHIWGFASLDDRQARRAALAADPEWQAFLPKIRDLIVIGNNKIMSAADFSPIGGAAGATHPST